MGQGTNHEPDKQVPITVIARYAHLLSPFRPTGDIGKDGQLVQIPFPATHSCHICRRALPRPRNMTT